jgi:hypothetical protein
MTKKFNKIDRSTLLSIIRYFSFDSILYIYSLMYVAIIVGSVIHIYFIDTETSLPIVLKFSVFVLRDLLTCSLFFQPHLSLIQWI